MLVEFFFTLRHAGVPVGITEFLTLLEGLRQRVAGYSVDDFYWFARLALVKDERHYDRFDRAFGEFFKGIEALFPDWHEQLPEDWLRALATRVLSDEERAQLERLGWDKLMETLRERLAEQKGRHAGGNKWIGTGGTSPFGNAGEHPEGVRIGGRSRTRSAVKVWEAREYRNFDDGIELGTRNIKVALRKLREFARTGAPDELDLDDTIGATARNAGWLDLKLVPERHNAVKVLLFLDVGGSMDDHVRICEELFSACRSEFKHLEHVYFHNCVYESVWRDNRRRHQQRVPTLELIRTYGRDYRLIFVGDATMSPYELTQHGGSVEHVNEESGVVWLRRLTEAWPRAIWLNPQPEESWEYYTSVRMVRGVLGGRMFPLTLDGLERGIRVLRNPATAVTP
ncbi:hypothetical protein EV699_11543 [Plasticicumulans lactativorans]|uniref:VWA domain containing CoxE-like protein n=1 Tax=Plasticicumulans lactativorans TaxID=1133106 RepID=A0A4R2L4T5_9GAMM|nr:VWA domain-containing protein [Plasticicumulans lactativorans]TCO80267.1 hypothetical protein EV699_11543 [Plasticicumulans lactativorans]